GYLELLRLQDRFVYLPEMPYRQVDLDMAMRNVLTQEAFEAAGGQGSVASWLNTITIENVHPTTTVAIRMNITIENVHPTTTVAIRMNNLSGNTADKKLYAYDTNGKLLEMNTDFWSIKTEDGEAVTSLTEGELYELHVAIEDGGLYDLSDTGKEIKLSVLLAQ